MIHEFMNLLCQLTLRREKGGERKIQVTWCDRKKKVKQKL